MEIHDIAQQSEACLSLKKRLLTSLWEDISPLLSEVLKHSRHPTEEDAVLELSRSELLFLALLQALRTKDMVMSGRLLLEVDNWKVLPRLSFYLGLKLHVEFNCPIAFFRSAAEFAHSLNNCGLFRVPKKILEFLDHLAECEKKEIEVISSEMKVAARPDLQNTSNLEEPSVTSNRSKRNRRRRKTGTDGTQQANQINLSSSPPSNPSNTSTQQQTARTTAPSPSTSVTSASPHPLVQKSEAEIEAASKALESVLGTNRVYSMISAIERGADVERTYCGMGTPLHYAAYHGHVKVIEALLKVGVNLEALERKGSRALHIAAEKGKDAVVAQLVEAGAEIHALDAEGNTPLQKAIQKGQTSTVQLLLSLGAGH